jgi:uncharacterized protein YcsI (UPF0317 family)
VRAHAAETTEDSPELNDKEQVGPWHRRSSGQTAADMVVDLRPCRGSQREQLIRAERRLGARYESTHLAPLYVKGQLRLVF